MIDEQITQAPPPVASKKCGQCRRTKPLEAAHAADEGGWDDEDGGPRAA